MINKTTSPFYWFRNPYFFLRHDFKAKLAFFSQPAIDNGEQQQRFKWKSNSNLTNFFFRVTEINRNGCYCKKPISAIYIFASENWGSQRPASRQIFYCLGNFKVPHPWLSFCVCFLCRDCVMCVLQTDRGYRQTWQVNTDARRYWQRVTSKTTAKVPWHFLDFYCHSLGPRPALLPLLIVMMWAYF